MKPKPMMTRDELAKGLGVVIRRCDGVVRPFDQIVNEVDLTDSLTPPELVLMYDSMRKINDGMSALGKLSLALTNPESAGAKQYCAESWARAGARKVGNN